MSKRIKERRLFMKMTQEELATALGLQKSAIAKYENGRVENIKRSTIESMSTVLNCKPSYLMGWDDKPNALPVAPAQASSTDERMLKYYRQLNSDGQKKLCERAEELIELGYSNKGDVEKIG